MTSWFLYCMLAIKCSSSRASLHSFLQQARINLTMALSARLSLFLAAYLAVCLGANIMPGQLPIPTKSPNDCVPMTPNIMRYCSYNRNCTVLPNAKGHQNLQDAITEFEEFLPLINEARCSPLTQVFLCFYYFPLVPPASLRSVKQVGYQFLPCRSVCESVRNSCEPSIREHRPEIGGWPDHLNCSLFPDDSTRSCIKPASSSTSPSSQPPTTPTTTSAPTTDDYSGSGETAATNTTTSPSTSPSPSLGICIQPETNQSKKCSCAKVRSSISGRTLRKGYYSFVAKVTILSSTTLSVQRGRDKIPVVGYRARIEENFNVSCETSRLQVGTEITLRTDMSPDCLCAIIEVNQEYVVAGYSTTQAEVMRIPTDKRYKHRNNGGCVFGCWQSKFSNKISDYARAERPLNNCSI